MHSTRMTESLPSYLTGLNPEQRLAVETTDGPVLVLSGAGTGKTRVLTTRIAHLIATKRAFPGQILAVTFTNKAAAEMRERANRLLERGLLQSSPLEGEPNPSWDSVGGAVPHAQTSEYAEMYPPPNRKGDLAPPQGGSFGASGADGVSKTAFPWLGTFHSLCAKLLRRHAELVGLSPQFTILDDDDQQRLIKALLAEHNIDHTRFPTRAVQNVIQGWKDRAQTPDKITERPGTYTLHEVAAKLYPLYQARLRTLNACDFGDLLLHVLVIFQAHPEVLRMYAERFRYILVDEYQDTNVAQYLWLRLLAAYHKNLCCVGDDDQSIYGWRGAEVGNILKFEKDYPGATLIRLERNYRSTAPILKAASGLIAHNETRLGKTLWTDAEHDATPIRVKSVWDDGEEARFVGEEIEAFERDRIALKEMAVLVRAGYQTRAFEERFLTLGVPYRVIGGLRFYERMEVRDAIAYLRLIHQPHDDLAFERIINIPKRGIGKATMEQLHTQARAGNCSLSSAVAQMLASGALKGKTAATLAKLLDQFTRWRGMVGAPAAALQEDGQTVLLGETLVNEAQKPGLLQSSPLEGEPNPSWDSVGGALPQTPAPEQASPYPPPNRDGFSTLFPMQSSAIGLPLKGGAMEQAAPLAPIPPFLNSPIPQFPHSPVPLAELTDRVLEESGYRAMWQADKSPEAAGRLENLRELVRAMGEFGSLAEFLEHVGLVTDSAQAADGDMVNIMSLHAAKGLEFDVVFLTGWEEGLFPSQRTMDELGTAGLEEERRLAYVGITRARKHLTISHASNRRIYNQWQAQTPSRFLSEIPPDTLEELDGGPYGRRSSGPAMFQREVEGILAHSGMREAAKHEYVNTRRETEEFVHSRIPEFASSPFRKGTPVFHPKFGNGVVLNVEGDHLQIAFKHAGMKKILAEYVEKAG